MPSQFDYSSHHPSHNMGPPQPGVGYAGFGPGGPALHGHPGGPPQMGYSGPGSEQVTTTQV